MPDKFIELISQYYPLSNDEIDYIKDNVPVKRVNKNEVIFREGNISQTIYFILEGCVRLYYYVDGNDKTAFFYTEGKFICAGESYNFNIPARENYQAIENTELMLFHKPLIEKLLKQFPNFELIARIATEDELITCQRMIASFVTKSPEERYLELMETNRELFQRVHQQQIASFLGVSPETLSRIKKRAFEKMKKIGS